MIWSMRGLCTALVICWRSVWRWGPAGQHRFSGRQVTNHLGLVPSFSCFFFFFFYLAHVIFSYLLIVQCRRGGLQEVWMVYFQTCNRIHSDHLPDVDSPECWGMVSCNWWCLSTLKQNHWKRMCFLACQNDSSLPLWSPFPVCIWPVYTRLYPPFCKHLLWKMLNVFGHSGIDLLHRCCCWIAAAVVYCCSCRLLLLLQASIGTCYCQCIWWYGFLVGPGS